MKKIIMIIVFLAVFLGVAIAEDILSNSSTINIPQEDIDILKLRYNQTEINPTASPIENYGDDCWFSLVQGGLYNQEITFDCSGMDNRTRLAKRDELIKHHLMYLANVTRERIAREEGINTLDAGGDITVLPTMGAGG